MREQYRNLLEVLSSAWRASRRHLLVSAVLTLLGAVSTPLIGVFLGRTTQAVVNRSVGTAVAMALAVSLAAALSLTMDHFAHIYLAELSDLRQLQVEAELGRLAQGTPGLEQQEGQEFADHMELLRKETWQLGAGIQTALAGLALVVQVVLTTLLLARLEPLLLLLPLFAVPALLCGRSSEKRIASAELVTAEPRRLGWHLLKLAVNGVTAKEIRLFGLQDELRQRQAEARRHEEDVLRRAELAGLGLRLLGQVCFAVGYVAALVIVVRSAIAGRQTIGDVVLVITLAAQMNAQAASALALVKLVQRDARILGWLHWLRRRSSSAETPVAPEPGVPETLTDGIHLRDVAFRYPGATSDVLRGVSLHLPAGSTVAIVGDNGAGKSTLVKLLARIYQPTAGTITVDGVDLAGVDADVWRKHLSAGFQDFIRFETTAQESIGLGNLPQASERAAVLAAARRADADSVVERLPDGLETHLGTSYEEGQELSGGQWQRIALGRAMMRPAPLVLMLDEPTAALDPLTEHALFERYTAYARETRAASGGITVLVSHRFSTVRMADLILVVADGRIAEAGSHEDLMALGKNYFELFTLQASAYR